MGITLTRNDSLHFLPVYTNLGLGFASGCLIIIAEIIYARLIIPKKCKILLLLALSATLASVTGWMINKYYDNPKAYYQFRKGKIETVIGFIYIL